MKKKVFRERYRGEQTITLPALEYDKETGKAKPKRKKKSDK